MTLSYCNRYDHLSWIINITKTIPEYRGLWIFNTQLGSFEAKSARNEIGEILEDGQINTVECIKRASPVFWRPRQKRSLAVLSRQYMTQTTLTHSSSDKQLCCLTCISCAAWVLLLQKSDCLKNTIQDIVLNDFLSLWRTDHQRFTTDYEKMMLNWQYLSWKGVASKIRDKC